MLGLAIGDALGAPVEGLKTGHIKQLYGDVDGFVDPEVAWAKKPHRWRMKALYTDDTQQALALADSLLRCRGFSADHFKSVLVKMAEADTGAHFGAHRGTGKNFRASVRAAMDGKDETGQPSAGIGAMMRVAPVGLFFADDEEELADAAIEQALVTHRDPRPLVMAAATAWAVARSATGDWDKAKPEEKLEALVEFAGRMEKRVESDFIHRLPVAGMDRMGLAGEGLSFFPRLLDLPDRNMVWKQIVSEANRQFPSHKITEPGQGFVMAGGLSALFIALTSTDYADGVKKAVMLGKDTDTMAAIVGAVLGARHGEEGIPGKWIKELINAEQVALRGEALCSGTEEGLGVKDVVEMEAELTRKEEDARADLLARMIKKGEAPLPPAKKKEKKKAEKQKEIPSARDRKKKKQKPKREKAPWKK